MLLERSWFELSHTTLISNLNAAAAMLVHASKGKASPSKFEHRTTAAVLPLLPYLSASSPSSHSPPTLTFQPPTRHIAAMHLMKTERRSTSAAKSKAAARPKSTPVKHPPTIDNHDSAEEEDDQTLRLFKHTPLPTTVDDDNDANDPLTTTAAANGQQHDQRDNSDNEANNTASKPAIHLTPADYNTLTSLYTTITTVATQLQQAVHTHLTQLPNLPSTEAGNSLYELKNRLLLQYLVRMVHVIRLRVSGASIAKEESVDEMNEIRVILERIRPVEKRIKYSIDKLLAAPAASTTGKAASTDPLQYRPNPLDLLPATASTSTTAAASVARRAASKTAAADVSPPGSPTASGLYQAPHHVPTLPTDARGRQPRVSAARLRSLLGEMGDRPEERLVEGGGYGEMGEASEEEEEKREYEERMMVRLVETKADKKRKRDREHRKGLDNMDEFDELRRFVERTERTDRDDRGEGRESGERRAGGRAIEGRSSVDELFNGVERGEGPRKRARAGGKKGKTGKGTKGRGGKRR